MPATNSPAHRRKPWLLFAVLAFFAVAIPFSALNQPGGPVTEAKGVIQSFGSVPSDVGPPQVLATVRLEDGKLIQANVLPGRLAMRGQIAHVHIYRRVFFGAQSYEIYRTESPQ